MLVRIVETAPGSNLSLLELLVDQGHVELLKRSLSIKDTYFDQEKLNSIAQIARRNAVTKRAMLEYVLNLLEWDGACEMAKNNLAQNQRQLWSCLRRHPDWCYRVPPTRRWSVAMQVKTFRKFS